MFGAFLSNFLQLILLAMWGLVLARVLLSWIDPTGRSSGAAFVVGLTEPILGPVRRALPRTGMIDLSPLIVLLVLSALMRVV
jgi:YggT family protein